MKLVAYPTYLSTSVKAFLSQIADGDKIKCI